MSKGELKLLICKYLEHNFEVIYQPWHVHRDCMLHLSGWASYVARWTGFFGGPDLGLDLG